MSMASATELRWYNYIVQNESSKEKDSTHWKNLSQRIFWYSFHAILEDGLSSFRKLRRAPLFLLGKAVLQILNFAASSSLKDLGTDIMKETNLARLPKFISRLIGLSKKPLSNDPVGSESELSELSVPIAFTHHVVDLFVDDRISLGSTFMDYLQTSCLLLGRPSPLAALGT